ncbi:MAG: Rieske 2Fe-2S domain-containing protein [Chloroflexota bacterium]|nr:Rieske 2Fe-2S domain-containing protein [Chloroflexota bacterium]
MPETIGDRLVRGDKGSFLDGLGNAVGAVVGGFYRIPGTRPLKDVLHGTWALRHPLHPALTDAVVGGLTVVAVLDVIYLFQRDPSLLRATDIALVVSLIAAVGALASGYTDWNETFGNERRLGVLHGLLMSLISVGYLVSLWLRVGGGSRDAAIALGLICWVLLAATAHLGGEMAFGFGTGVDRQAWAEVPGDWETLALRADALEERKVVRAQMSNGFALAVAKLDGALYAIGAVCTHASGPLDEGELVGDDKCDVKCPWHGSVFSFRSGTALHGPATMDEPTFETRIAADGRVEVKLRGAGGH